MLAQDAHPQKTIPYIKIGKATAPRPETPDTTRLEPVLNEFLRQTTSSRGHIGGAWPTVVQLRIAPSRTAFSSASLPHASIVTTAPNFEAVANTVGVTEDTIRDFFFGPHPTMPAIALSGDQTNDVTSFIMSLKTRR